MFFKITIKQTLSLIIMKNLELLSNNFKKNIWNFYNMNYVTSLFRVLKFEWWS